MTIIFEWASIMLIGYGRYSLTSKQFCSARSPIYRLKPTKNQTGRARTDSWLATVPSNYGKVWSVINATFFLGSILLCFDLSLMCLMKFHGMNESWRIIQIRKWSFSLIVVWPVGESLQPSQSMNQVKVRQYPSHWYARLVWPPEEVLSHEAWANNLHS